MDLLKTQAVLARIYTDAAFRQRFFSDPLAVAEEIGLLREDAWQLAQLPSRQVGFFAESLLRKRLNEVAKLLPLSYRAWGEQFSALFRRYASEHGLEESSQHRQDALAFCKYLKDTARRERLEPGAMDLLRYEAAGLTMADPGRRWNVMWLHYPLAALPRLAQAGSPQAPPRLGFGLAIWFRLSRRSKLRHSVLAFSDFPAPKLFARLDRPRAARLASPAGTQGRANLVELPKLGPRAPGSKALRYFQPPRTNEALRHGQSKRLPRKSGTEVSREPQQLRANTEPLQLAERTSS